MKWSRETRLFYQRLKHMVDDKIHSHGHDPIQILTRQLAGGQSPDGDLCC